MKIRRRILPIYAKINDRSSGKQIPVGVEIAEAYKPNKNPDRDDPLRAEGRISMRFFNCSLPKDTQILTMLEPWEAFDLYCKVQEAVRSDKAIELKLAPHKYVRSGEEIMTTVSVEKWVRGDRSGYALKAIRKGVSHNISMDRTHLLHAAEFLKWLSAAQSYQEVEINN